MSIVSFDTPNNNTVFFHCLRTNLEKPRNQESTLQDQHTATNCCNTISFFLILRVRTFVNIRSSILGPTSSSSLVQARECTWKKHQNFQECIPTFIVEVKKKEYPLNRLSAVFSINTIFSFFFNWTNFF